MRAICWDFDGTLVYSHCLWSGSIWKALKETVPDTTILLDDVRPHTAIGFTWHMPENDYSELVGERWWDYMNKYFENIYLSLGLDGDMAKVASQKVRSFIKDSGNYHLYDDTISTLEWAKEEGFQNILLSNNYPDLCDVLSELGLMQYFDAFVISAQIGYDKPRKEIFDYAKKALPDIDRYYMVGDSVSSDIVGGKESGMVTILVHKPFNERADHCISSLGEICNIL